MKTRAWDYWGNEIKSDIWTVCKELKMLQAESVIVTSKGLSRYSRPTDFSRSISDTILEGANTGVCQDGGGTTTAKLAATLGVTENWLQGKEIIVYLTADLTTAYVSQCTAFNTSTKVATVSPAWSPSPDSTYSYIIVDKYFPQKEDHIVDFDSEYHPTSKGRPSRIHPIGDADYGEFWLFQAPDKAYGLKQRYYANLTTIDEAGTLHATCLNRWRNTFIQGIMAKQLQDDDDKRAENEMKKYHQMVNLLSAREEYGMELSDLQATVCE